MVTGAPQRINAPLRVVHEKALRRFARPEERLPTLRRGKRSISKEEIFTHISFLRRENINDGVLGRLGFRLVVPILLGTDNYSQ